MVTPTKEPDPVSPRVTSGWGSHRSFGRSASTQRARTAVTQKPFTRTATKVTSLAPGMSAAPHDDVSLDNLSIRELHEAFRSTYGRETSVKDKHWLKRQISAGWLRQRDAAFKSQVPSRLKTRLDQDSQAEQPLPSVSPSSVGAIERDAANDANAQGANGAEFHKDLAWNGLEGKGSQHGMTTPASVSTSGRFDVFNTNSSGAARGQIAIYGEVVNTGVSLSPPLRCCVCPSPDKIVEVSVYVAISFSFVYCNISHVSHARCYLIYHRRASWWEKAAQTEPQIY